LALTLQRAPGGSGSGHAGAWKTGSTRREPAVVEGRLPGKQWRSPAAGGAAVEAGGSRSRLLLCG